MDWHGKVIGFMATMTSMIAMMRQYIGAAFCIVPMPPMPLSYGPQPPMPPSYGLQPPMPPSQGPSQASEDPESEDAS